MENYNQNKDMELNKDNKLLYSLYERINRINDKIDSFIDSINKNFMDFYKDFYYKWLYKPELSKQSLKDKLGFKYEKLKEQQYIDKMKDKKGIIHLFFWYKD